MTRLRRRIAAAVLLPIVLVSAGCSGGQGTPTVPPTSPPPDLGTIHADPRPTVEESAGPQLVLPSTPLDLPGQLLLGSVVRFSFAISNVGAAPLVVSAVEPGCGCTRAEVAPHELLPGEAGLVNVTFDTNWDGPGPHWEALNFVTNDPQFGATRPPLHADLWFTVDVVDARPAP